MHLYFTTDDLNLTFCATTTSSPQSMIESRYRQFDTSTSLLLEGLDLSAAPEQYARARALVNAPIGLPLSIDQRHAYEAIISHVIGFLSSTAPGKVTALTLDEHLKTLYLEEVRADHLIDVIPTQYKNEMAFRVWIQTKDKYLTRLVSRVLLFVTHPTESAQVKPILFFYRQFGNVDLCLISSNQLNRCNGVESSKERPPITFCLRADIVKQLQSKDLVSISHYLDHGQTLNLSEFKTLGFGDLSNHTPSLIADPYQQYLNEISYYALNTFNGSLITRTLPKRLRLLHLTPHKKAILASQELKVSRAGCIGNMVYTTLLVGDKFNMIGGHTIGLCNRLACLPNNDSLILLRLTQTGNRLTNWIEKLGRGRIFLEVRNRMLSNATYKSHVNRFQFTSLSPKDFRKHAFQIDVLSIQAVEMYNRCHELFSFCIYYSQLIKHHKPNNNALHVRCFLKLSDLLMKLGKQENNEPYYSILNSIFFETIKDYILLFQSDNESYRYRDIHSFNMHMQYLIFFELFPRLKTDWNTSLFPMDISNVECVLEKWGFFDKEDSKNIFMIFLLNRFAYYINVAGLEGAVKLPAPSEYSSFDALSNQLPNLTGNIFNTIIKKYKKSTVLEQYMGNLRACYNLSYDSRGIKVAIKSGLCGTDEIGVRPHANIHFFNLATTKKNAFFKVKETTRLNLAIGGPSEKNGFTDRGCSTITQITIASLNDPLLDFCIIGQHILEQYYLKQFKPYVSDRHQDSKHFEVKSHKIPRVTHGAMHASRVMLYVKVIHFFRLKQHDPMAIRLTDFALSQNITLTALIHLTQFAALFHDSARLDEGSDRWDKESSMYCLKFLTSTVPKLQQNLVRLIANTIAFKDDEQGFLSAGLSLGFTETQMNQADYLRQLIHDADCLDIMRVKSLFKTQFLEMTRHVQQTSLLELIENVLGLIRLQNDQYKDCTINHNGVDMVRQLAAFDIECKYKYEWNPNAIKAIMADMKKFTHLNAVFAPCDFEIVLDEQRTSAPSIFTPKLNVDGVLGR